MEGIVEIILSCVSNQFVSFQVALLALFFVLGKPDYKSAHVPSDNVNHLKIKIKTQREKMPHP